MSGIHQRGGSEVALMEIGVQADNNNHNENHTKPPELPELPTQTLGSSTNSLGSSSTFRTPSLQTKEVSSVNDVFYIPAYLSVNVKKMDRLSFANGTVNINMTIILRVKVRQLHPFIEDRLDVLILRINEKDLEISEETCDVQNIHGSGTRVFVIRTTREVAFRPTLKNYPFDIQNVYLEFELLARKPKPSDVDILKEKFRVYEKKQGSIITFDRKQMFEIPQENLRGEWPPVLRFNMHITKDPEVMLGFKKPSVKGDKKASIGADNEVDAVDELSELRIAYGLINPDKDITLVTEKKGGIFDAMDPRG